MPWDEARMADFLALARTVKTQAGEAKYGQPIGSVIVPDSAKGSVQGESATEVISPMHLRSLRRMIAAAEQVGDKATVARLTKQFQADFSKFAKGKSFADAMALTDPGPGDTAERKIKGLPTPSAASAAADAKA